MSKCYNRRVLWAVIAMVLAAAVVVLISTGRLRFYTYTINSTHE
jgi:hypothetical protein